MNNPKTTTACSQPPLPAEAALAPTPHPDSWNYEMTVTEIETTIAQIESGDLDLADVFDQFGSAVENLRQCEAFLAERQQQMDLLIETLSDESEF